MQIGMTTDDEGLLTRRSKEPFGVSSGARELHRLTAECRHRQNGESRCLPAESCWLPLKPTIKKYL
jgi:hypothetical protein